ncbi:MAG: hypothetical protein ACI4XR_01840 [Bacilli bacterium]
MKIITIILIIFILLQIYRVTILFLKKEQNLFKKIFEFIIFIFILIIELLNMKCITYNKFNIILLLVSITLAIYIGINIIYEILIKKESLSILSIKIAIDLSNNGIMFLNDKGNIILINKVMNDILKEYKISSNYIEKLQEKTNEQIIKCLDRKWQLIINNNEVVLFDITDLYNIQEKIIKQNIMIEENNIRLIEELNNIEKITKEKKIIKIKNEFHDMLGHRLSLFIQYLKQDNVNKEEIKYMLNNLFEQFDSIKSPIENLNKLIEVYKVFNININIVGKMPNEIKVSEVFFEIIREAVTNAIIHADSKNIKIVINNNIENIEMIITNDGKKPNNIINENEGIKGMRRKLNDIGGILIIETEDNFLLKVIINNQCIY